MIAKDFQEATATRIVDLFRQGHNRVLLADEVGLGKTIVAKTVVEKTGVWRKEINDPDYVVVYICSNAGIANQNCSKLGIAKENRVSISEGRLSGVHAHGMASDNASEDTRARSSSGGRASAVRSFP